MFKLGMNKMYYTFLCISERSKSPYACKMVLFTDARKVKLHKVRYNVNERETERWNMNSEG